MPKKLHKVKADGCVMGSTCLYFQELERLKKKTPKKITNILDLKKLLLGFPRIPLTDWTDKQLQDCYDFAEGELSEWLLFQETIYDEEERRKE